MARTGLRMMPTFPSPPPKFRTAGFPRYGYKASMSDGTFLNRNPVKLTPSIPAPSSSLSPPFARFQSAKTARLSVPTSPTFVMPLFRDAYIPEPQGPLAPVRVLLSRSIVAYYDPIRQSRRHAATSRHSRLYAAPSLCGSASATHGTFPTFTAVLAMHAVDPTPVVRRTFPLFSHGDSRLPRISNESPTTKPVSASNVRRGNPFRGCIVRFMLRPAPLPSPPDWLRHDEATHPSPCLLRYIVTPAFGVNCHQMTLGVRLDGRTGNLPSSGLSPDQLRQPVRLHRNAGYGKGYRIAS
jgi:hypothetical protein